MKIKPVSVSSALLLTLALPITSISALLVGAFLPFSIDVAKASNPVATWQGAGCDDLTTLNAEWRTEFYGVSQIDKELAQMEVDRQNEYGEFNNLGCANILGWRIVSVKVRKFFWQFTLCNDGWKSYSTGRGTCSWHGGINSYRGYYKKVNDRKIQFYWVN